MALYLDIDIDYFINPIIKESRANHRPLDDRSYYINDPYQLFSIIKHKEIALGQKRYIFTNHMQSHLRWWLNGKSDNTIIHIDAHSDLYGNPRVDLSKLERLGCQNFLWHSIREGLISEIYWVFPDKALDLTDNNIVMSMFTVDQIKNYYLKDNILNIEINCLLPGGQPKNILYHLLKATDLPLFNQKAEIITVATSPEFIPRQADPLVTSVGRYLNLETSMLENILQQHLDMKTIDEE
ncbi:hypothetical protein [Desulforamulus reducens]|uniref:hypothetical protein n=1 Tax=Desulforamulus reducens TaxID=59610 RepID=UPI0002E7A548|nr:hypothetical protein [Desulforamulus reducens]